MSENESGGGFDCGFGCVDCLPFLCSLHGFCFFASGRLPSAYDGVFHRWTYLVHGFASGDESENANEIGVVFRHLRGLGHGGVDCDCGCDDDCVCAFDLQFVSHFVVDRETCHPRAFHP